MAVAVLGLLLCVLVLLPCIVASGCKHEGREIPEGGLLTTAQPCFSCRCSSGSLQCRLQVCPRIPDPPPSGCELIRHPKRCCPQLVCGADKSRKPTSSIVPSRRPGCQLDGNYYREGSKLPTNPEKICDNCYCIKGKVHCTPIICSVPLHGCKPVLIQGSCCPSRYDCTHIEDPDQSTLFNETKGHKPTYTENQNKLTIETNKHNNKSEQKLTLNDETQVSSTDSFLLQTLSEGRSNREMSSVIANITETNVNNQTEATIQSTTDMDTTFSTATDQQYSSSQMSTSTDSSNLTTSDSTIVTTTIGNFASTLETETSSDFFGNNTEDISSNSMKTETPTMNNNFSATTELTPFNSTELSQTNNIVTFSTTDLTKNQTDRPIISKSDNQVEEPIITEKNKFPFLVNKTAEERIDLVLTDDHVLEHNELRIDGTTEIVEDIITMQTESTFMTMMPTTVIMPEEADTVNITLHSNVNITAYNNKSTLTTNTSVVPERSIPPQIEAIINITQKNQDYDEYDYNDPSLPPSLPGVRIIPFVAADAVVEEKPSPTVYPSPEKIRPTDSPVFFDVSHNNMFSPPVETEGGFVPHEPNLDGPFYDSKYNDPYHTTGMSIPSGHLPVDLTTGTIMPPSITILPKDERCLAGGREYHHGSAVPRPGNSCSSCTCYFGEVLCQPLACPPPPPGCHTAKPDPSACCPRLTCGDIDTPTVVLEAPQHPAAPQAGVVPPVTVATGVVTPDPFRHVIRTEPAPDLPALMGDIMPYLLERRGSTSPLPSLTTDYITTTGAPIIPQTPTTSTSTVHTTKAPLKTTTSSNPVASEEEKEDSEFSLDSVLQFLFSGETTVSPGNRQPNTTKHLVSTTLGPTTADRAFYELHSNISNTTTQQHIASTDSPTSNLEKGPKSTSQISTTPAPILTTVSQQQSGLLSADPGAVSGLLKLAGCNIYGRMYRVGRIISELSGPCLECMCTEVGVQCRALDC